MHQSDRQRDTVSVLNGQSLRERIPMIRAIRLMEQAFPVLSAHEAYVPPRVVVSDPGNSMSVFFKPAFLSQTHRMSIKILTQIIDNPDPKNPTIKGMVLLIDTLSGRILSICDGQSLTAIRTGAASGIAAEYLSNPESESVAIFGCGAQGYTQLEAIMAVRPIRTVFLFDRSVQHAENLANAPFLQPGVLCTVNPGLEALRECDIICTATPALNPLFQKKHIKPGVHINAIGSYRTDMQEIDPYILRSARVYLDDAPACLTGSGDLVIPIDSGIYSATDVAGELGELIAGKIPGRQSPSDITVFKSVGNAIQDFFIANEAYENSDDLPYIQKIVLNG